MKGNVPRFERMVAVRRMVWRGAVAVVLVASLVGGAGLAVAQTKGKASAPPKPKSLPPIPVLPVPAKPAAPPTPPARIKRGDVTITHSVPDGKKLTTCTVYLRDQVFTPASVDAKIAAKGVPAEERLAVTADAQVGAGDQAVRYLGVGEVRVPENKTASVKVVLKPVKDLEAFCLDCHPPKAKVTRKGQIYRDVHVTGKPLEGKYLEKADAYNAQVKKLRAEGKPAPEPIVLETRIVIVGGKEVKKQFYTCESCHTPHATTKHTRYARAGFKESSELCLGCHY